MVEEIRLLEVRIAQLERQLSESAKLSPVCCTLLTVPGVGLLTATALVASTGGAVQHFRDARHFASWFGLTPKEHSSGSSRYLGHISKRGDRYLRTLLTHGARAVLRAASHTGAVPYWIHYGAGDWLCRAAPTTTRRPALWLTSSPVSATPLCAISSPTRACVWPRNSSARLSRCRPEPAVHSQPATCEKSNHPSWP